jgi:hypothetical protein
LRVRVRVMGIVTTIDEFEQLKEAFAPAVEIWRLENEEAAGIYSIPHKPYCPGWEQGYHPTPGADAILGPLTRERSQSEIRARKFGFETIEQYQNWFVDPRFRRSLYNAGIFLSKYIAHRPEVWFGETQVMFLPEQARRIELHDPAEFG